MSTLKVTDIQSNSTSFNTPVVFKTSGGIENGQLVKAWANWNGQGTVATRADFNVNSIGDNGPGDFSMNFSNAMPDTNYAVGGCCSRGMSGETTLNGLSIALQHTTPVATTSVRVGYSVYAFNPQDRVIHMCHVFR